MKNIIKVLWYNLITEKIPFDNELLAKHIRQSINEKNNYAPESRLFVFYFKLIYFILLDQILFFQTKILT